jgi:potassium efflux system protein
MRASRVHAQLIRGEQYRGRRQARAWLPLALLVSATALAQLPIDTPPAGTEAPIWQPPDLVELPQDWWAQFETISPDIARQRFDMFLETVRARMEGLEPESLVAARDALDNLESLIDLLQVAKQSEPDLGFEPVLTQNAYNLDEILVLQSQRRNLDKERARFNLQISQLQRQGNLLEEQRESLLRQYLSSAVEAPRRILTGIDRVAARVEYELTLKRIEDLRGRLQAATEQENLVRQQERFARDHLEAGDVVPADLEARASEDRARLRTTSQNVAAAQRQLLDALSAASVKPSLELLRKQQLTRASAEAAHAELEVALSERKASWYRFRAGQLETSFDQEAVVSEATRLIEEILRQVDVWSAMSQSTLVAAPPQGDLNTVKNFELAQSVARETLLLTEQIRETAGDLVLVQDILTTELIESRSGLSKAWGNLKLATGSFWQDVAGVIDYRLFSIGDAPVTFGSMFKALLILLLAYGISRLIRHFLALASRRRQHAESPAIYTLGRLLHYVIILIGVFAALGSIGMDFTNFALIAGALSVGIGFGLQAIVNNFVSGLILLFEGSLRIGDYIELDSGLAGVVKEINTRATIVNSNDGVDVVVPNSELVTTKLTNWTLRENVGRLRIPFGVAYGSDKEQVRSAALKAAADMEFILLHDKGREPQVRLVKFGDSALEFELLAWVSRPGIRRPHRVRASFLWSLETHLREAGIEIPFPQRDLHLRSGFRQAEPEADPDPATAGDEPNDRAES